MTVPKPITWKTYAGQILACLAVILLLFYLLLPGYRCLRNSAQVATRQANMHSIGKAIRRAIDDKVKLMPAIRDEQGRSLLSWRVALLPYLDDPKAAELYQKFKLNEAWNSTHNLSLIQQCLAFINRLDWRCRSITH